MAKIYRFTAYVVDVNEDFNDADDYIEYVNNGLKYGGSIKTFVAETADLEWDDDVDVNQYGCPRECYDRYFNRKED